VLFNAFPYPTKISPEAIAIFIACHTSVGDTILDPFGGSGSVGLATMLCDNPTEDMKDIAKKLGVSPKWGARKAVIYELSPLGSFVAEVMCNPPDPSLFEKVAAKLLREVESEIGKLYNIIDPNGDIGRMRYVVWSDVLVCPNCKTECSFWDAAVTLQPLMIGSDFNCTHCGFKTGIGDVEKAVEKRLDPLLGTKVAQKKRVPVKVYGRTGKKNWSRLANDKDYLDLKVIDEMPLPSSIPLKEIKWGDLYRKGYHLGITHLHHFYTRQNLIVIGRLWEKSECLPKEIRDAVRLSILSYNASHSTLMSRVVVKNGQSDFIVTSAQSGVLYVSSLPVEQKPCQDFQPK